MKKEQAKYKISPKGKRKLDFPKKSRPSVKLPLTGKTLYLDVKDVKCTRRLEADLKKLGGTIEEFLSKDINYLITSQPRPTVRRNPDDLSPTPSPFNCDPSPSPGGVDDKKPSTTTRGKAIAERARIQTKTTSTLLDNAEKWGIKIVTVEGAFKYINKELQKLPKSPQKGKTNSTRTKASISQYKTFKAPFVKFEALTHAYRPCTSQLEAWPRLNVDTPRGSCPFDGTLIAQDKSREERGDILAAQVDISTPDTPQEEKDDISGARTHNKSLDKSLKKSESDIFASSKLLTAGELQRKRALKKRQERKRGYCECCRVQYEDLYKHCKDDAHREYVRDKSHFERLALLIKTVPSPASFLKEEKLKAMAAQNLHGKAKNEEEENEIALISYTPEKKQESTRHVKASPNPSKSPASKIRTPTERNKTPLTQDLRKMTPNGKCLLKIVKSPKHVRLISPKKNSPAKPDSNVENESPRMRNVLEKFDLGVRRSPRKIVSEKQNSPSKSVSRVCQQNRTESKNEDVGLSGKTRQSQEEISKNRTDNIYRKSPSKSMKESPRKTVDFICGLSQKQTHTEKENLTVSCSRAKSLSSAEQSQHIVRSFSLRKSPRKPVQNQSITTAASQISSNKLHYEQIHAPTKESLKSPKKSANVSPAKQMHYSSPGKSPSSKRAIKSPKKSTSFNLNDKFQKSIYCLEESKENKNEQETGSFNQTSSTDDCLSGENERTVDKIYKLCQTNISKKKSEDITKDNELVGARKGEKLKESYWTDNLNIINVSNVQPEENNQQEHKNISLETSEGNEVLDTEEMGNNGNIESMETERFTLSECNTNADKVIVSVADAETKMEINSPIIEMSINDMAITETNLGLDKLIELGAKKAANPTSSDDFERCILNALSQGELVHKQRPEDLECDRVLRSKTSLDLHEANSIVQDIQENVKNSAESISNSKEVPETSQDENALRNEIEEKQILTEKEIKLFSPPPNENLNCEFELPVQIHHEVFFTPTLAERVKTRFRHSSRSSYSLSSPGRSRSNSVSSNNSDKSAIRKNGKAATKAILDKAKFILNQHEKSQKSKKYSENSCLKNADILRKGLDPVQSKQKNESGNERSNEELHHKTGSVQCADTDNKTNDSRKLTSEIIRVRKLKKINVKLKQMKIKSEQKKTKVNSELQGLKDTWNDLNSPSLERSARKRCADTDSKTNDSRKLTSEIIRVRKLKKINVKLKQMKIKSEQKKTKVNSELQGLKDTRNDLNSPSLERSARTRKKVVQSYDNAKGSNEYYVCEVKQLEGIEQCQNIAKKVNIDLHRNDFNSSSLESSGRTRKKVIQSCDGANDSTEDYVCDDKHMAAIEQNEKISKKKNMELQGLKDWWNDINSPSLERSSRTSRKVIQTYNDSSDLTEEYDYEEKIPVSVEESHQLRYNKVLFDRKDKTPKDEVLQKDGKLKNEHLHLVADVHYNLVSFSNAAESNIQNVDDNFEIADGRESPVFNSSPVSKRRKSRAINTAKKTSREDKDKFENREVVSDGNKYKNSKTVPSTETEDSFTVDKVEDKNTENVHEKANLASLGTRAKNKVRISRDIRNSFIENSPISNMDKNSPASNIDEVDKFSNDFSKLQQNFSDHEKQVIDLSRLQQNVSDLEKQVNDVSKSQQNGSDLEKQVNDFSKSQQNVSELEKPADQNIAEHSTPNSKKKVPSGCYGSGYSSTPRSERRKAWKRKNVHAGRNNDTNNQAKKKRKLEKLKFVIEDSSSRSDNSTVKAGVKTNKNVQKQVHSVVKNIQNSAKKSTSRIQKNLNHDEGINTVTDSYHVTDANSKTVNLFTGESPVNNENLNDSFSLQWKSVVEDENKVKLNKSWSLLSSRSVSKLLSSEDGRESFDGFTQEDLTGDSSLASDMSYEECWEVDKSINSDKEFEVDVNEKNQTEEKDKMEVEFDNLVPTFSSPNKRSDSSWFDAVEVYINKSVEHTVEPLSGLKGLTSPRKGSLGLKEISEMYKSPTKSPRNPRRRQKLEECPVLNTDADVQQVDNEIQFNFGSPRKNDTQFSPLKVKNGRLIGSPSPGRKTSTPTRRISLRYGKDA